MPTLERLAMTATAAREQLEMQALRYKRTHNHIDKCMHIYTQKKTCQMHVGLSKCVSMEYLHSMQCNKMSAPVRVCGFMHTNVYAN